MCVAIPPPGWAPPRAVEGGDSGSEGEREWCCNREVEGGEKCTAKFSTFQKLAMHIRKTGTGTHGPYSLAKALIKCNICPVCRVIFSDIRCAQEHVEKSLLRGYCYSKGARAFNLLAVPEDLECPVCKHSEPFLSTEDYLDHLRFHINALPCRPGTERGEVQLGEDLVEL